ncbi:MAG: hypothetical protein AUH29_15930 [Candidatus Rokubacteria bacterium 13_1_40CM_69_27]|nr:MAG: hypothetical protein AUH29_15930 [Candidatus Rokubacteria bacterium 13_1_40CM_69_27]OLC33621.1 MAG: hypothetical protein AUH81_13520 [Candidatus Rokubacteria bacterium 13_1_40CM_4_69_5]
MDQPSGRRRFLKSVIAMGAVGLPAPGQADEAHAQHAPPGVPAASAQTSAAPPRAYMFLTPPEVAFVEAAAARLIPADELGPGAKEAGVAYFIDQQLFGAYGTMAKKYRQGPWPEGTPQQGYQSPLTPQEVYRAAIRESNLYCRRQYGKTFDELAPEQQDQVLRGLDEGKIALESVPSRFFFDLLLANTQEGFFADPVYGGNRNKIGWKLVGFPGVPAVYTDHIEKYNVPYLVEPVSIADVQQNLTQGDEHGHPQHVRLSRDR